MAGLPLPFAIVVVARTSCLWGQRASRLLNLQQGGMSPAASETPDKMSGGPPARCLRYDSRVIFGKEKGNSNLPRTARTV